MSDYSDLEAAVEEAVDKSTENIEASIDMHNDGPAIDVKEKADGNGYEAPPHAGYGFFKAAHDAGYVVSNVKVMEDFGIGDDHTRIFLHPVEDRFDGQPDGLVDYIDLSDSDVRALASGDSISRTGVEGTEVVMASVSGTDIIEQAQQEGFLAGVFTATSVFMDKMFGGLLNTADHNAFGGLFAGDVEFEDYYDDAQTGVEDWQDYVEANESIEPVSQDEARLYLSMNNTFEQGAVINAGDDVDGDLYVHAPTADPSTVDTPEGWTAFTDGKGISFLPKE